MNAGFVYILGNEYMGDVIKIGCTEKSPHARADELSKPTGIPAPFRVLCYIEIDEFQAVERRMHEWCKDARVSSNREFFDGCLRWAVSLMWWMRGRLAFCDATADPFLPRQSELLAMVDCSEFCELRDPWKEREPAKVEPLPVSEPKLVLVQAVGGDA